MPFPIDSDLAPIDAGHMTAEGEGVAVKWQTARIGPTLGWKVGKMKVDRRP